MGIFFYTDSARTQPIIFKSGSADGITLSSSDTGALNGTKLTVSGLGDVYYSTKYDSSLTWARSIFFANASALAAEAVSDLYTNTGFQIHIGIAKTSEGVYQQTDGFKIIKPDGTTWKNGQTTTITITDAESDKVLRIIMIELTYTLYSGETVHGYYIMPGWVRITTAIPPEIIFIPRQGVWLNDTFFAKSETDPQGGIPQQPEGGDGSHTLSGGKTIDTGSASGRSSDMGGGGINTGTHGTHVYELDGTAYDDFLTTIYGRKSGSAFGDLWQQFKNFNHDPLSGILSAFIIPAPAVGSATSAIRLSGQGIAVSGTCKAISQRFVETSKTTIYINAFHNSYLDYAPYTKITLYLPFVGTVSISTNEVMRGGITVWYWIDFCTGDCVAYVDCFDWNGYHTYYNYSGNCASFIPVSANDAGISSIISGTTGVIGGVASIAGGNVGGMSSIIGGVANLSYPQTHEKHVGGFSGGSGALGILYPFVVVNRPSSAIPAGFTSYVGGMSAQSGAVGDYSGYTVFDWADVSAINGATDDEKAEILNLLQTGVYL